MQKSTIEKLTRRWQRELRLSDWALHVSFKRRFELDADSNLAQISWNLDRKIATLLLRDPRDDEKVEHPHEARDVEKDIVHELLHLHLAPLGAYDTKDQHRYTAEEQAIDLIAEALVNANRRESSKRVSRARRVSKKSKKPER